MAKCPFAIWTPITGGSGRHKSGPFKIVHHTTEGSTASGAMATFKKHRSDPHFTVDGKNIYQHVDTEFGARALRNESGGVQTNRDSAIQIEVVGFAAKAKDTATLANVARLCRWIEKEHGVPQVWPNGFPKTATSRRHDPGGHNRDAKNWDTKGGHYGHCHVPENTHWDPGYTTAELKVVMDNVLSTGAASAMASAPSPVRKPMEIAIGGLAATGMVLTNRFVEVSLDASGRGSAPIEVAWERVLSVMPRCDAGQSPEGWGQVALGERDGESVVMVHGGRPGGTVQVLLKTLDEAIDEDAPLAHCPEGDDEDDEPFPSAEGIPKRSAAGLAAGSVGEDWPPNTDMLEVADTRLDDIDAPDEAELNSPTPSPEILALDELLDERQDLRSPPVAFAAAASTAASVYWPRKDVNSPDYLHLNGLSAPSVFELLGKDIETLIKANRFEPAGAGNIVALALRGCQLKGGEDDEQVKKTRIELVDVRPDHVSFRCVLGFYYMNTARLTLLPGSTVPAVYYMEEYYKNVHGLPHSYSGGANLLPTGCYVFRVGRHSSIRPALRMSEPDNLSRDAEVTVLRTTNDLAFGTADIWDRATPYDNIHCSYTVNYSTKFKAYFSSAGCLTVRGRKSPSHQWAKFQSVLDNEIGQGKRCDLLLLTGKECALAADLRQQGRSDIPSELVRLRAGSRGPEVSALQRKLGVSASGYFGPATKHRLTEHQRRMGIPTDGVFCPELDRQLGWSIF